MRTLNKSILLVSFLVVILATSACSSKKPEGPKEISEGKSSASVSLDTPEGKLIDEAKRLYQSKLYSMAQENFEALRTAYPLGPYAEFADLKIADCYFETKDYQTAAQSYEDFAKNRPASLSIPYALFRAGRSYQLATRGAGRDVSSLDNANKMYSRLLKEYPNSMYRLAASEFQSKATKEIAKHEKEIINFYKKKNKDNAAKARNELYEKQINAKVESAKILAENEADKEKEERTEVPVAVTVSNIPDSSPEESTTVKSTTVAIKTTEADKPVPPKTQSAQLRIQEARCENGEHPRVFVFLTKAPSNPDFVKANSVIKSDGTKISLSLPEAAASDFTKDCLGTQDLSIRNNGTIELKTSKNASLMLLQHPDRLLIYLQ